MTVPFANFTLKYATEVVGSNAAQRGTQWSHRTAVSVLWLCVWVSPDAGFLLVLLWCSSGDFRLKVCDQVTGQRLCHDMMDASRSPALDSSCAIFSNLLVLGYGLSWRQKENPGEKPAGDPRSEISTVRFQWWRALAGPPRHSVPRVILYLQQDEKKKKKNPKHSPSAIDLNIFLSYKRRKLLLF